MSTENNKALVRQLYEAINTGNLDSLDVIVSDDFIEHEEFPGLPTRGPEAPKAALGMFKAAFPDLVMVADEILADGNKIVVRGTMSGTHKGDFMGIAPTNKSFKVQFIDIVQVDDGKATAHWGLTDQAAMLQQLGLVEM